MARHGRPRVFAPFGRTSPWSPVSFTLTQQAMTDPLSITVSIAALVVSMATAWATLFRRGALRMTKPSVVYFGADGPLKWGNKVPRKVHLRALLYSTGKRGV